MNCIVVLIVRLSSQYHKCMGIAKYMIERYFANVSGYILFSLGLKCHAFIGFYVRLVGFISGNMADADFAYFDISCDISVGGKTNVKKEANRP